MWPLIGSSDVQMAELHVVLALFADDALTATVRGPGVRGAVGNDVFRTPHRCADSRDLALLVPCHLRDLDRNQLTSLEVGIFDNNTALTHL